MLHAHVHAQMVPACFLTCVCRHWFRCTGFGGLCTRHHLARHRVVCTSLLLSPHHRRCMGSKRGGEYQGRTRSGAYRSILSNPQKGHVPFQSLPEPEHINRITGCGIRRVGGDCHREQVRRAGRDIGHDPGAFHFYPCGRPGGTGSDTQEHKQKKPMTRIFF